MAKNFGGSPSADTPAEAPRLPSGRTKVTGASTREVRPRKRGKLSLPAVVLSWLPGRVIVLENSVIPSLVQTPIVPGTNGIALNKAGKHVFTGIAEDDWQRGGLFLDPAEHDYLGRDDDGRLVNEWSTLTEYVAFVRGLVENGTIEDVTRDDVVVWVDTQKTLSAQIAATQAKAENYTAEIDRQIAVAERWLEAA